MLNDVIYEDPADEAEAERRERRRRRRAERQAERPTGSWCSRLSTERRALYICLASVFLVLLGLMVAIVTLQVFYHLTDEEVRVVDQVQHGSILPTTTSYFTMNQTTVSSTPLPSPPSSTTSDIFSSMDGDEPLQDPVGGAWNMQPKINRGPSSQTSSTNSENNRSTPTPSLQDPGEMYEPAPTTIIVTKSMTTLLSDHFSKFTSRVYTQIRPLPYPDMPQPFGQARGPRGPQGPRGAQGPRRPHRPGGPAGAPSGAFGPPSGPFGGPAGPPAGRPGGKRPHIPGTPFRPASRPALKSLGPPFRTPSIPPFKLSSIPTVRGPTRQSSFTRPAPLPEIKNEAPIQPQTNPPPVGSKPSRPPTRCKSNYPLVGNHSEPGSEQKGSNDTDDCLVTVKQSRKHLKDTMLYLLMSLFGLGVIMVVITIVGVKILDSRKRGRSYCCGLRSCSCCKTDDSSSMSDPSRVRTTSANAENNVQMHDLSHSENDTSSEDSESIYRDSSGDEVLAVDRLSHDSHILNLERTSSVDTNVSDPPSYNEAVSMGASVMVIQSVSVNIPGPHASQWELPSYEEVISSGSAQP